MGGFVTIIKDSTAVLADNQLVALTDVAEYLGTDSHATGRADAVAPNLGQSLSATETRHALIGRKKMPRHLTGKLFPAVTEFLQEAAGFGVFFVERGQNDVYFLSHPLDVGRSGREFGIERFTLLHPLYYVGFQRADVFTSCVNLAQNGCIFLLVLDPSFVSLKLLVVLLGGGQFGFKLLAVFEGSFVLALQLQELGRMLFEFGFCLVPLFRYSQKPVRRTLYLDVEFLELNELTQFRAHRVPPFFQGRVYYIDCPFSSFHVSVIPLIVVRRTCLGYNSGQVAARVDNLIEVRASQPWRSLSMKLLVTLLIAIALAVPASSMRGDQAEGTPTAAPGASKSLPPIKLQDFDGNDVPSDQFKGNIMVLDFWATWCVPCIAEIPALNRLQEKYGAQGVKVLGVTLASGDATEVKPFVGRHKMKYTVLMGDDDQVYDLNVVAFPTTYVVTRDMKVFSRYIGASSTKAARLEADIQKLLGN